MLHWVCQTFVIWCLNLVCMSLLHVVIVHREHWSAVCMWIRLTALTDVVLWLLFLAFYVSANILAGGSVYSGCSWVHLCICAFRTLLLTWCPEKYWTLNFHHWHIWDTDENVNVWHHKVKGQGRSMTKGPAGGGIQNFSNEIAYLYVFTRLGALWALIVGQSLVAVHLKYS